MNLAYRRSAGIQADNLQSIWTRNYVFGRQTDACLSFFGIGMSLINDLLILQQPELDSLQPASHVAGTNRDFGSDEIGF